MVQINTFVFVDIETTGLPSEECNKTRITEISMVAAKRDHLMDTRPGATPRVQNKITFCLNPGRIIYPSCSEVTGLCNDLLEHAPYFNRDVFQVLDTFLNVLEKPICLVAQNGFQFDYPILKNHLVKLGVSFSEDLLCADSLFAFYHIFENQKKDYLITDNAVKEKETEIGLTPDQIKRINESTPKRLPPNEDAHTPVKGRNESLKSKRSSARRLFPWSGCNRPKESYKLKEIHERLLNRPSVEAHRAENDCIMLMECIVACGEQILKYMDTNHRKFSEVKHMEIGVRIGLLFLTGALWGCTNPFIRQGTKGLRSVKSKTWLGQAAAEVTFLLGNWKYVLPWLVNQGGSLVYLAAVRRSPLSLAVPVANSLAFAFTAITDAVVGAEEPLDAVSILGVGLIALGTAFCCWDSAEAL